MAEQTRDELEAQRREGRQISRHVRAAAGLDPDVSPEAEGGLGFSTGDAELDELARAFDA